MAEKASRIKLVRPNIVTTNIHIKGLTSLITNRRTPEKIEKKTTREKDENKIFQSCLYPKVDGKHSFPATGLKRCAIDTAHTFVESIPKTKVRGAFFIPLDYIPIFGDDPIIRKDVVTVGRKSAIERIRAEFKNWEMIFPIQYDSNGVLSLEIIINLFATAGNCVGIGDWRPACNGTHGRFEIAENSK